MTLNETIQEIKDTVGSSTIYITPFELDSFMMSLGAISYYEDNSEYDFKDDSVPMWYFPKFNTWVGIEKEYQGEDLLKLNDVYEI